MSGTTGTKEIVRLKLSEITADPGQPRQVFDQDGLDELAESIKSNGLLQPISVRAIDGGYTIIAGERRYRATELTGADSIEAIIFEVEEMKAKELQLLENIVRRDLNPIETAQAYQSFIDKGYTAEAIGQLLGRGSSQITWLLGLLNAGEVTQHLVAKGHITVWVGVELGKLTYNGQTRALRVMRDNKLSPTECIQLCKQIWGEENQVEMFVPELSEDEVKARRRVTSAIEKAGRALAELDRIEEETPGIITAAVASELDTTEERVDLLIKSLRKLKTRLTGKRVAMLKGAC